MKNGFNANSLQDALKVRAENDCVLYAGGTDLMVENRKDPVYLFLSGVPELKVIEKTDRGLEIGSGVTFTQAIGDALIPELMKEALTRIAAPAVRNAGTFGGNLGNGSAKADSVLIEYVLDARLVISSVKGEREIAVEDFYKGRKELDLGSDEIITKIILPDIPEYKYYYQKVGGRNALAISRVSFAGVFSEDNGKITRIAAAFGAVAPTVLRYKDIEDKLIGKTKDEFASVKEDIISEYADRMQLTKGRVSAEYRKTVCMNLLRDFYDSVRK